MAFFESDLDYIVNQVASNVSFLSPGDSILLDQNFTYALNAVADTGIAEFEMCNVDCSTETLFEGAATSLTWSYTAPEPASFAVLGAAIAALWTVRRRAARAPLPLDSSA